MRTDISPAILRHDYRPYGYALSSVRLHFDLDHEKTTVRAEMDFVRTADSKQALVLCGQALDLTLLQIDGRELQLHEYERGHDTLVLHPETDRFTVTVSNTCQPANNTSLMGLYASGTKLFTQCEPEGFRRITWFPDRPDVMSPYQVTLRANKHRYPLLLSNGNLVRARDLEHGRHEAVWEDPHPKPSYLFALVAGEFDCREKQLTTRSGRPVRLQVYSDVGTRDKTAWALQCLEHALRWDEETFGLELDLDRFMVVATRDFNMGAMENKGLNIFNASYVLACKDTATDTAYRNIEAVIGHEYFHNWTGNRVTCRDWFQLSLKEGLTVFREQEFSADMLARGLEASQADSARAVKRIDDVDILRTNQFPEDAGPMAHPIRPESYQEISNFYTATIYEKGAEVIRMLHTILGKAGFRAGLDAYFRRHDGQAVTCDDFIDAMESVYKQTHPDGSLDVFRRWYEQAGTPRLAVQLDHNATTRRCTLTLAQHNPPVGLETLTSPTQAKPPVHIPVAIGMYTPEGKAIPLEGRPQRVLALTEEAQSWTFEHVDTRPVLSILRSFSAPVIVDYSRDDAECRVLARHDEDLFARWEAVQDVAAREVFRHIPSTDGHRAPSSAPPGEAIVDVWQALLADTRLSPDYLARALALIGPRQLLLRSNPMDPIEVSRAYHAVHAGLGRALTDAWQNLYADNSRDSRQPYDPNPMAAGRRALRALALSYLLAAGHPQAQTLAEQHYFEANNLSDRMGALRALTRHAPAHASAALLDDFYQHHACNDPQVMDAWFSLQASASWADTNTVKALMQHPEFVLRNPNRARSVIFQFCLHTFEGVHTAAGYAFWAEQILALDALNPEVAARLARGLDNWSRFAEPAKSGMRQALQTVQTHKSLSPNVAEIVSKALNI